MLVANTQMEQIILVAKRLFLSKGETLVMVMFYTVENFSFSRVFFSEMFQKCLILHL